MSKSRATSVFGHLREVGSPFAKHPRVLGLAGALLLVGCRASSPLGDAGPTMSAEERAQAWLTIEEWRVSREELVALSEELTVASTHLPEGEATKLLKLGGDVWARAFRIGHAEADARVALKFYARAAESEGPDACEAAAQQAELSAELARDPGSFYREAYLASRIFDGLACASSLEQKLRLVEAFRPGADLLASLDAEARRRRGEGEAPGAAQAIAPPPSHDAGSFVLAASTPGDGQAVKVLAVDPYGSRDRARVVITLSGPTRFEVGSLAGASGGGESVFVDLERAEPSEREVEVGGIVERVRMAAKASGTRVVLDLSAPAGHRVFSLPEPFRIVVDIATQGPAKLATPPGAPRPVRRVAIDPGHGGHDPGAVGPSGLREKDITLDIAHRVAPILSRELGIMTLLTRDDDRFVPLAERTARANAFHADLFVSIHCNASESSSARGVATFVFDTSRDESLAKIAARENATSLTASLQLADFGHLEPVEVSARSRRLAELLDRTTMASLAPRWSDTSSYGVKAAGFFVLVGAEMPSVLFETSFISNPIDEARLATPDYRQKLADAIVNAIRAYREGR